MKHYEFINIKNMIIRLYQLLNDERKLRESSVGNEPFEEFMKTFNRYKEVINEMVKYQVKSDDDIPRALENIFADIKSDTDKKIYYLKGFAKLDELKRLENYDVSFDEYLIYMPRDTKFDPFKMYYAIYQNIIDPQDIEFVCFQDRFDFEKINYIIDDEIDIPYQSEEEYNELRHNHQLSHSDIDSIENAYREYRIEFFKYLIKANSEEEAVKELSLNHQNKKR